MPPRILLNNPKATNFAIFVATFPKIETISIVNINNIILDKINDLI